MLLRYTQESAQPFVYKGCAIFASKLEIPYVFILCKHFFIFFKKNFSEEITARTESPHPVSVP